MQQSGSERLDGWKSISRFLGRNVRTAQLWERDRGLPVHRIPGGAGQTVFAYASELQSWLARGTTSPAEQPRVAGAPQPRAPGLLVLPFEYNAPGGSDRAFIGAAIAQELLQRLTVTPLIDLRVLSWTTARSFRDNAKRADELARDLGIRYVVEGAVLDAGSRWQVDIRLVDAREDRIVFADRFGAQGREVLGLQTTMAEAVAGHLALQIGGRLIEPFWQSVVAPEAFLAYVRAAQLATQRSAANIAKSLGLLEEACAIEPGFVPARATLARHRLFAGIWLRDLITDDKRDIGALVSSCLDEAPQLAETQYLNGLYASAQRCDWEGSDRAYLQVIEALPSEVRSRGNLAINLMVRRHFDEAERILDESRGLEDPRVVLYTEMALNLLRGRQPELRTTIESILANDPHHPDALLIKAQHGAFYLPPGIPREPDEEAKVRAAIAQMGPVQQQSSKTLLDAFIAVARGDASEIRVARDRLVAAAHAGTSDWFYAVLLDAVLHDIDAAVEHMRRAIDCRNSGVQNAAALHGFARLRQDPRFAAQLRRINLPA